MAGKKIGYIRVSSIDQNPDRQLEGVKLDKKFIEHASGRNTQRPQLVSLLDYVRDDDTVIVHSMDRLARNLVDLRNLIDHFSSKKVKVQFVKENLLFDGSENAMSMLFLSMMGAFAEFERAFIRERQQEGIALAKKRGVYAGRKTKLNEDISNKLKEGILLRKTRKQLSEECGIGLSTLYAYAKKLGLQIKDRSS